MQRCIFQKSDALQPLHFYENSRNAMSHFFCPCNATLHFLAIFCIVTLHFTGHNNATPAFFRIVAMHGCISSFFVAMQRLKNATVTYSPNAITLHFVKKLHCSKLKNAIRLHCTTNLKCITAVFFFFFFNVVFKNTKLLISILNVLRKIILCSAGACSAGARYQSLLTWFLTGFNHKSGYIYS